MRSPGQPPKPPGPRRFADDAARDTVILSTEDIQVTREALTLVREDREPGPPRPRPARAAPARTERPAAPRRPATPAKPPPWRTVLATTIQLWWQRRGRPAAASPRGRVLTGLVLAAVLLAAAALGVTLSAGRGHAAGNASHAATRPDGRAQAARAAALRAAATARTVAAAWLAQQVTPGAIVACDPQMCAAARQAGLPATRLLYLGAGPASPQDAAVLVATATVREEYGARLASVYAPDVLASFGTGRAQVAIRVVAPAGAAAYAASLRADQAARLSAGQQLLRNPRIHAAAGGLPALANGQVDTRLLTALAGLATRHQVRVLGFAAAPAGASPGLPLRTSYLAPAGPGTARRPASFRALARFLRAQPPPYRPASITEVRRPGGRRALRVEFAGPSPLGLLSKT